jgi:hypothetical protein
MALRGIRLLLVVTSSLVTLGTALAQTDVVTNGGFESGLTSWTAAPSTGNGNNTTCNFNASTAGGTETLTGTSSLAPSAGTGLAIGGMRNTGSGAGALNSSCTLYQDVAIPPGATTATLNLKWGLVRLGSTSSNQAALLARVYASTAAVPYYLTSGIGNAVFQPVNSSTALETGTSGSFDVSSVAGTTVRLVLFIAMTPAADAARGSVGNFDDVQLLVTVPSSISQSFGAASIPQFGSTSLTYTITNAGSGPLTTAAFTNTLPAGLVVSTPNGLTGSCGGGTITAVPGSGSIALSGATVAAASSCSFSVNVTATTVGTKVNSVTLSSAGGAGNTATASLTVVTAPPTITSVSPSSGPSAGGNAVTITGTNFIGATALTFGGVAASSFAVVSATSITAIVPAGAAAGPVSVIVTAPSGFNAANTLYSYIVPVPTLSEWGMIGLAGLLILYGYRRLRRLDTMAGAS